MLILAYLPVEVDGQPDNNLLCEEEPDTRHHSLPQLGQLRPLVLWFVRLRHKIEFHSGVKVGEATKADHTHNNEIASETRLLFGWFWSVLLTHE